MLRLRDRTPKQHGAREKKKAKKSHPLRSKATEFCAKGSRVNRGLAGLHSAGELKK